MPEVIIVLGSASDLAWANRIVDALQRFEVTSEIRIGSAHKTPGHLLEILRETEGREGERVYITVAGRSNALSGFVDASVTAPVVACPPPSDSFGGMDVLSSIRMPSGVAPMLVLEPGNAALAAVKMLGLRRPELRDRVRRAQQEDRDRVIDADQKVLEEGSQMRQAVNS